MSHRKIDFTCLNWHFDIFYGFTQSQLKFWNFYGFFFHIMFNTWCHTLTLKCLKHLDQTLLPPTILFYTHANNTSSNCRYFCRLSSSVTLTERIYSGLSNSPRMQREYGQAATDLGYISADKTLFKTVKWRVYLPYFMPYKSHLFA